jgi:tellurite resistance protein TehA-like permease
MPPERVPSDGQSTNHTVPLGILRCPRYARHHWPLTYEPALWSVVSPLGMYSVATLTFGKVARLAFMEPLRRFMLWVALAAWVTVAAPFLVRLAWPTRATRRCGAARSGWPLA